MSYVRLFSLFREKIDFHEGERFYHSFSNGEMLIINRAKIFLWSAKRLLNLFHHY